MQYILSEVEFKEIQRKKEPVIRALQSLVLKGTNNMDLSECGKKYCDDCPFWIYTKKDIDGVRLRDLCPNYEKVTLSK